MWSIFLKLIQEERLANVVNFHPKKALARVSPLKGLSVCFSANLKSIQYSIEDLHLWTSILSFSMQAFLNCVDLTKKAISLTLAMY